MSALVRPASGTDAPRQQRRFPIQWTSRNASVLEVNLAHLSYPIEQATHSAAAIRPVSRHLRPSPSRIVRALSRVWQWACHHAERPERVVPYF
jgi:hypothetical protein